MSTILIILLVLILIGVIPVNTRYRGSRNNLLGLLLVVFLILLLLGKL